MGRLDGKVAVITGGASGIGEMVTQVFAREGAKLAIFDCNKNELDKTVAQRRSEGYDVIGICGDISVVADAERAMQETYEHFGALDILVNDAGVCDNHYPITRTPDELWHKNCDVNQTGTFNCCRAALKYMEKTMSGSIVNVSSIAGVYGTAGVSYAATKFAIIGITKNIAVQFAGRGIRCNAVCPGPTQWTSMNWPPEAVVARLDPEMREITGNHWNKNVPWTVREDQANAMLFFASDESKGITGQYLVVDNGKDL